MEVSIDKKDGLDATLSVKVSSADYQEELEKSLINYRKKMNLPGFRQGKVPMGVVRKMIEKDAKRELVEKFLQQNIQDYISKNNIKLILSPLSAYTAEDINWQQPDFEFTYDVGLRPEINIDLKPLNKLKKYKVEISDEDVEEEIERLRKQAGNMKPLDKVGGDDEATVAIHFHELDPEGKPLEGGLHKTKMFKYADIPAKLKKLVDGKEKGYKTEVNINDIFSESEIMDTFGIDKMTAKDLGKNFEMDVTSVFTIELPELKKEFFARFFDPGKVSTEEEFRAEWKKMIENYFNQQADNALAGEVKKALLENVKLEFPEGFLKKYLLLSYEKETEEELEDFESKMKAFKEELKWLIISEYIAEQQGITISEEDVIDYTKDMIRAEFARSGMQDVDDATLRQYGINYLTKENNFNRTSLALRDGRVFEYLLSQLTPKEESISSKKFEEIRNNK